MKTLFRIIALVAVISLSCVCFSEESEEKVERAKLADTLKNLQKKKEELDRNQEELRRKLMELNRQRGEILLPQTQSPYGKVMTKTSGIVLSSGRAGDIADISIVITSEDGHPERIAQVTEDMGIMARILDKKVLEIPTPKPKPLAYNPYVGDKSFYYVRSEAPREKMTRGIYISGYGALFLMEVDFPLRPQVKVEEKEEKKADVGDIWEQTKDELTGRYQGTDPSEREIKSDKQKVAFNEAKVKELKEKIIKALKYSSKIRCLEPGENIIVAVKSVIYQGGETIREINLFSHRIGLSTGGGFDEEKESSPITGVTIMVEKGDVDSFAEGELDYEQFCKVVEITTY